MQYVCLPSISNMSCKYSIFWLAYWITSMNGFLEYCCIFYPLPCMLYRTLGCLQYQPFWSWEWVLVWHSMYFVNLVQQSSYLSWGHSAWENHHLCSLSFQNSWIRAGRDCLQVVNQKGYWSFLSTHTWRLCRCTKQPNSEGVLLQELWPCSW